MNCIIRYDKMDGSQNNYAKEFKQKAILNDPNYVKL